jgi:hypothetical protein
MRKKLLIVGIIAMIGSVWCAYAVGKHSEQSTGLRDSYTATVKCGNCGKSAKYTVWAKGDLAVCEGCGHSVKVE